MATFKSLLIPADITEPLKTLDFDSVKPQFWSLMLNLPDNSLDFMTFPQHGVQFMFDALAFERGVHNPNLRVNMLEGRLRNGGKSMRLTNMLEGNFLLIGMDKDRNAADVPEHIADLAEEVDREAVVFSRQVDEATVALRAKGVID